ncbi:hypothetical protein AALA79_01965 [Lachnospiraceae bacterium 64-25]
MSATLELTPEKAKQRVDQANEMAAIWEQSDIAVQMYLKGCIVTAKALSDRQQELQKI